MKQAFSEIEGLNLLLKARKAELATGAKNPNPLETQWTALRTALETASARCTGVESTVLVRVGRIELPSPVWKTGIIAVIRHPLV